MSVLPQPSLELLREWKDVFPPALLSQLRGLIWRAAGDQETAAIFFEHAARTGASNGKPIGPTLDGLQAADTITTNKSYKKLWPDRF